MEHDIDPFMIKNAVECIKLDFPYSRYTSWLDSFVCTKQPDLVINRLSERTYTKLMEILQ